MTAERLSSEKGEYAQRMMVTNATGAGQEIMFAAAAGSHPRQGVEAFKFVGAPNANEKTKEAAMPAAEPAGLAKQSGCGISTGTAQSLHGGCGFRKLIPKGNLSAGLHDSAL